MLRTFTKALFGGLFVVLAFSAPALAQDYSSQPAPQSEVAPVFVSPVQVTNAAPSAATYGFSDSLPETETTTTTAAPKGVKLAHTGGNYLLPISAALVLLGFGGLLLTGFRQSD